MAAEGDMEGEQFGGETDADRNGPVKRAPIGPRISRGVLDGAKLTFESAAT